MAFNIQEEIKKGPWKEDFGSSHIKAIMWLRDYDSTESIGQAVGRMYVNFHDNKVYLYFDVPYNTFYYFWRGAPSKGGYFARNLRSDRESGFMPYQYKGYKNVGVGIR